MKICVIPPYVMKANTGGLNTQVENTISALEKHNVHVDRFNPWTHYNWEIYDLVHIFRADFDTISLAQWLHNSNIPIVLTPVFYNTKSPSTIRWYLRIEKILQKLNRSICSDLSTVQTIAQKSSLILPNTKEERSFFVNALSIPAKKVTVVPNAVESFFQHATADLFYKQYGISDMILSVGNFGYQRKNMFNLLKALENIIHPAVLIGKMYDTEYSRKCKEIIDRNNHIHWIGELSHDDPLLASAYAAAKVYAQPSTLETPGLAALEAALTKSEIVITPYGGPREYFQSHAQYPDPQNVKEIEEALKIALKKEQDSSLKNHILDNFTYEIVAQKLIGHYQTILPNRGGCSE